MIHTDLQKPFHLHYVQLLLQKYSSLDTPLATLNEALPQIGPWVYESVQGAFICRLELRSSLGGRTWSTE